MVDSRSRHEQYLPSGQDMPDMHDFMPKITETAPKTLGVEDRLDTPVFYGGFGRSGLMTAVGLCLLVCLLMGAMGAAGWQMAAMGAVSLAFFGAAYFRPRLLHLTSPPWDRLYGEWHCLMRTTQGEALWRGRLVCVENIGEGIRLGFDIHAPTSQRLYVFLDGHSVPETVYQRLKSALSFFRV